MELKRKSKHSQKILIFKKNIRMCWKAQKAFIFFLNQGNGMLPLAQAILDLWS